MCSGNATHYLEVVRLLEHPRFLMVHTCFAQLIAEAYPGASVTVAAERFLQDTTSWGAAGL